jgi:hypothetical protein
VNRHVASFLLTSCLPQESKATLPGKSNHLPPRSEDLNGNDNTRSSRSVFDRRGRPRDPRWREDIAPSMCQESSRIVGQSTASFPNGGRLMATTSRSGGEVLRLPELLGLIKRTAEGARNRRVLNPREAMVPDEVKDAEILYARARAWPSGEALRRGEPKWRKPGDVEAAFFALYDALRSRMSVRTRREREEPNPVSNHISLNPCWSAYPCRRPAERCIRAYVRCYGRYPGSVFLIGPAADLQGRLLTYPRRLRR